MDFQARQYDAQLGRFLGIDPLAYSGGQQVYSPHAAMGNAPGEMIDPNGERFSSVLEQKSAGADAVQMQYEGGRNLLSGGPISEKINALLGMFYRVGDVSGILSTGSTWVYDLANDYTKITQFNKSSASPTQEQSQNKEGEGKKKMKSEDQYDYSQDVISGKMQDDLDYIKNGEDGNMLTRWFKTIKRDWNAKDNVVAKDISELTEFGINVLPVRLLKAGPTKLTQYESVIDLSKFSKPVKGSGNMVDPKSGYYLSPTKGNPHGNDAVYKLFDSKGNRIGAFDSNGKYLRP